MTKPNKDGWIRHRGGECPVDRGVMVDVRYRDGVVVTGVPALLPVVQGRNAVYVFWEHHGVKADIMAYRLHQQETKEPTKMTAEQIRTEYTENLAAIAALHKEQAALVQQLRELGFALVDVAIEPEVDMSDPKNWRAGDLVECVCKSMSFTIGSVYELRENCYGVFALILRDDVGQKNGHIVERFKFHSRPTKK